MNADLENTVDLICLVYHEARNVRHPIKKGKLQDADKYNRLRHRLSHDRDGAWQDMKRIRSRAVKAGTVEGAVSVFEETFGLSLQDLIRLYEMPIWKDTLYGGNKWAGISSKIWDLVQAMESGMDLQAQLIYREVTGMYHNTGRTVTEKLHSLKS